MGLVGWRVRIVLVVKLIKSNQIRGGALKEGLKGLLEKDGMGGGVQLRRFWILNLDLEYGMDFGFSTCLSVLSL